MYGWNSVNAVVSGRPMMFAICAGTYKQEARRDMVRVECVGWREWREGFRCGEWRACVVVVSGGACAECFGYLPAECLQATLIEVGLGEQI